VSSEELNIHINQCGRAEFCYECTVSRDLLDARQRIKELEKEIVVEFGFCPRSRIRAENCGCDFCSNVREEGGGDE